MHDKTFTHIKIKLKEYSHPAGLKDIGKETLQLPQEHRKDRRMVKESEELADLSSSLLDFNSVRLNHIFPKKTIEVQEAIGHALREVLSKYITQFRLFLFEIAKKAPIPYLTYFEFMILIKNLYIDTFKIENSKPENFMLKIFAKEIGKEATFNLFYEEFVGKSLVGKKPSSSVVGDKRKIIPHYHHNTIVKHFSKFYNFRFSMTHVLEVLLQLVFVQVYNYYEKNVISL